MWGLRTDHRRIGCRVPVSYRVYGKERAVVNCRMRDSNSADGGDLTSCSAMRSRLQLPRSHILHVYSTDIGDDRCRRGVGPSSPPLTRLRTCSSAIHEIRADHEARLIYPQWDAHGDKRSRKNGALPECMSSRR